MNGHSPEMLTRKEIWRTEGGLGPASPCSAVFSCLHSLLLVIPSLLFVFVFVFVLFVSFARSDWSPWTTHPPRRVTPTQLHQPTHHAATPAVRYLRGDGLQERTVV